MSDLNSKYKGLRYGRLVRCSTDGQADTSIPDQLQLLGSYADGLEMVHAGAQADFLLPGVSGSHPADRKDIEEIIRRKKQINDFEVLVVQDLSRLTRGGVEHGGSIEFDLAKAGVRVVFAGTPLPEGDHAGILKSVEYFAAQQYAKSVSFGVTRGLMSAILSGRQSYCLRPPFGVDRLYVSLENRPLYILRNLCSGIQQKLDPTTLAVIQTYPKPIKGQTPIRARKQAGEHIVLIPGAPEYIQTVRQMFKRVLIDGWGDWRVAKELNDQGILSPNGKQWTRSSVKCILRNPIYVGLGIGNRRSGALYHERDKNAPRKLSFDLTDLAQQKRPKNRHRPRSQWVEQPQPQLKDFLGAEMRDLAAAYQARFLTDAPKKEPVRKHKHVGSFYILSDILHSKQGNLPMTGRTQGSKEKPYRYYTPTKSHAYPCSDNTQRRIVPAEPIECAAIAAVGDVLADPNIRNEIIQILRQQENQRMNESVDLGKWKKEQEQLQQQLGFVIDELGVIGKEAAKQKIRQLEGRLADLNQRIENVASTPKYKSTADIEAMADRIVAQLAQIPEQMSRIAPQALRQLISSMVVRLEVDLETRAVVMEIALPSWAFESQPNTDAGMGLGDNPLYKTSAKAQSQFTPILAVFDCVMPNNKCCQCERRAA